MSLTKFASFEVSEVLDVKGAPTRQRTASIDKIADFEDYRTSDGYLYARIRAISSRVNQNHDGWPSIELAGSPEIFDAHRHSSDGFTIEAAEGNSEYGFSTFIGKPIFVDHNNSDPKRARGVIVDSKFRVLDQHTASNDKYWKSADVDKEHMPASEIELLLEVDAKSFPKLAKAIVDGDIDGFSMGCDVDYSKCSHCGHEASTPDEYCTHVMMKGAVHDMKTADGKRTSKKSYENCYGVKFFEISAVFNPADETALAREVRSSVQHEGYLYNGQEDPAGVAPADPVRPNDLEVETRALALERDHGIPYEQALQLATNELQQGVPGHGEGGSPADFVTQAPGVPGGYDQIPQALMNQTEPYSNDPRWGSTKTAENPLPQSMETRAPDEVDTLRDQKKCPICASDMTNETCDVCGYVEPPKEFDNPDLNKAEEIREQMKQDDAAQAGVGGQPPDVSDVAPPGGPPGGAPAGGPAPGGPPPPTKGASTVNVTNEMGNWTPLVTPKTAARINQVENPANPSNPIQTDEPKNAVVKSDQTRPVTSAMKTAHDLMARAQRNHTGETMNKRADATPPGDTAADARVDTTGVGGVMDASNDSASNIDTTQVDVTGIGGTGVEGVEADKTESLGVAGRESDDSGFNKDKTTDDSGPTKTFGDSDGTEKGVTDPVTTTPYPSENGVTKGGAYDDKTLEQNEQQGDPAAKGGTAVKGVQPVAETFGERENVLQHHTTPANNSGPTKTWSGTDGNGVLKQQEPVTKNLQEWAGEPTPDVKLHTNARVQFMASLRLAEAEEELGLLTRDEKYSRIAELENTSPESINAQLAALKKVKTAGLAKLAQQRQSGVRALPKAFGKNTAAPNGFKRIASDDTPEPVEENQTVLDSGLFSR